MLATAAAEEPLSLPEITVEASRLDRYLPARTEVPREQLIGSSKSELSDVLELTPGLNVRQGGRGEPRVDVRGFDQRATLFTLNGVPVYEPYNGIVNLDLFPLEMLGNVEIARGPSSSLYGPNGMAGTVKMTTFAPRAPVVGALSSIWRNSSFFDSRASAALSGDRLSAMVGGRFLTTPGFPLSGDFDDRPASRRRFEDGGERVNSDRDEKSAFANLGYKYADEGRVHATFLGSVAEFGIPPSTTSFEPMYRRNEHQELDHLQAGFDQRLSPDVGLAGAVFYSAYSTKESQFDGPDLSTEIITTKADSDEVGGIGRLTLELGERDSLAVGGQVRQAQADISDSVSGTLGDPEFTTASLAFENAYYLTEHVALLVGLSGDLQTGGGRGTEWELNPQGGVSVDLGRFGTSRAGVSRKIRFPTLRELFDPLQGNPDLKAERAIVYEVGHRVQMGRAYVDANLFRADVSDLIEMEGGGGDPQPAMNFDEAVQQGIELAGGARPVDVLQLDLNYTYLDAKARSGSQGAFSEIQHKPAHRFNGILQLFLPQELVMRLESLYTSEQVDSFGTDVNVDGFALFNVQLAKAFGDHLDVFAGVDNILDTDYEQKLGSPDPGRREYAGLRLQY